MAINKSILRAYAQLSEPERRLSLKTYFSHTEHTLTIFDAYPKARFHFLILPRIKNNEGLLSAENLTSLRGFLNSDKENRKDVRGVLWNLKQDGEKLRELIEEEMRSRYGFVWKVYMGFHAVESTDHIHLHVISEDLCDPGLKTKKHYNSFHPGLGFFLHIDDVLSWFDEGNAESYTRSMAGLDEASYEERLKEPLECFRCAKGFNTVPALKTHLQEHYDRLAQRGKATEADTKRKRKRDVGAENNGERDPDLKKDKETENKTLASDSAFEVSKDTDEGNSDDPRKRRRCT